jgi:hypothetical protein
VDIDWPKVLGGVGTVLVSAFLGVVVTPSVALVGLLIGLGLILWAAVGGLRTRHKPKARQLRDVLLQPVAGADWVKVHATNIGRAAKFEAEVELLAGDEGFSRPATWPIRWEGTNDARVEILSEQTKTLELATLDHAAVDTTLKGHHIRDHWQFHTPTSHIDVSFPIKASGYPLHLALSCRIHRVTPPASKSTPMGMELNGTRLSAKVIDTFKMSRWEKWKWAWRLRSHRKAVLNR